MTEEAARLVREIRNRAHAVNSFVADYRASLRLQLMPLEVTGKIYFLSPDMFRSETWIVDEKIVTVRKGREVQRYIPKRHEIWKYNLDDLPQTEPINFGIADLKDPFFVVDETGLEYKGKLEQGDASNHLFSGAVRNWARQGLLDTRKGFSIRYQQKELKVRIELHIDSITGLLRRMTGVDSAGEELFQVNYVIREANLPVDESLFVLDESTANYRVIDITDILLSSLNPNAAELPPSPN
jgi:outer membrane lipoprotein-sorting protein